VKGTKPYKRLEGRITGILTRGIEFPNEQWARIYNDKYLRRKRNVKAYEPF